MRRFIIVLFLALLILPLGGCLKSEARCTLRKDGSGTITSSYSVHLGRMRELLSSVLMMMNPDAAQKLATRKDEDLPNPLAANWLRLLAKDAEGYELTRIATETLDGERTTTVAASFQSLEAAARGGAFFTFGVSLSRVEKSEKVPHGAWTLVLRDILLGAQSDEMGGMTASQMAPMFETQLKKLSLTNVVTLPTTILKTNGKKNEKGDTVTWTIDYEKVIAGKDVSMSVTFEAAEDLKLKAFSYAPNLDALVKRMRQSAPQPKLKPDDAPPKSKTDEAPPKSKTDEAQPKAEPKAEPKPQPKAEPKPKGG